MKLQDPPMILVPLDSVRDAPPIRCPYCRCEVYPVYAESGVPVEVVDAPSLHWLDPSPESADRPHSLLYGEPHRCRGGMAAGAHR